MSRAINIIGIQHQIPPHTSLLSRFIDLSANTWGVMATSRFSHMIVMETKLFRPEMVRATLGQAISGMILAKFLHHCEKGEGCPLSVGQSFCQFKMCVKANHTLIWPSELAMETYSPTKRGLYFVKIHRPVTLQPRQ